MRLLVALALALAGCYRGSAPAAPPANKAGQPDSRAADDVLAFLPLDSHAVFHLDLARLRSSPLWGRQISRLVDAIAGPQLGTLHKLCGFELETAIDRVAIGVKSDDGNRVDGVIVARTSEAKRGLECIAREGGKTGNVKTDGDVILVKNKRDMIAVTGVGRTAVVAHSSATADRKSLGAVLASGAPLRASPAFLATFDRLEPGASMWFVLNGSTPMFASLAATGFKMRMIDGTVIVGESYVVAARARMASPDAAQQFVTLLDNNAAQVRAMVETFEVRAQGDVVRVDLVVTEPQAQTIMTMLGGLLGP